ncbi:MAG: DUF2271 domain-containing protein [Planctomycetes bacterium]|nr:DUF2271 domain-containing protein [Planctomycetota bacterium]
MVALPLRLLPLSVLLATGLALPGQATPKPPTFRFAREGVLGTSAVLVVQAADKATAARAEAAAFDEIARLDQVLSTWNDKSELSQLLARGGGPASSELCIVLNAAHEWRTRSKGAYDPRVTDVIRLWQDAARTGREPEAAVLAAAVAKSQATDWTVGDNRVELPGALTLGTLAKGWILDMAARMAATTPGVVLQSLQIGGDTRFGPVESEVDLTDPRQPAANGKPLRTLQLQGMALGSSGSYARGFEVAGKHHSHIVDPRTGKPCDGVLGAYAIASDAATADVLAMVLCVLGPEAGLPLLDQVPGAAAIVVTADGKEHVSPDFEARAVPAAAAPTLAASGAEWPAGFGVQIDFEIKGPAANAGGRGRGGWKRPYVAVWVEDLTGAPARTLCLWLEDRRWLRDLRRWSRLHADLPEIERLVAQATRKAGAYTLVWDGKDDDGRQLHPGRYTVCIEVAREHGTYQLMKHDIDLVTQPQAHVFPDNEEVANGKVTFGKLAGSPGK